MSRVSRVRVLALAGAAWVLLASCVARADELPPLEGIGKQGCVCSQVERKWYTHVWAEYAAEAPGLKAPDEEHKSWYWTRLYSIRDSRWAALKDCDRWLERLVKAAKKEKADAHSERR